MVAESDSHERRLQVVFRNIYELRRRMDLVKSDSNLYRIQNSSKSSGDLDEINYERHELFEYIFSMPYRTSDYHAQNIGSGITSFQPKISIHFYNHYGDYVSGDKIIVDYPRKPLIELGKKLGIDRYDLTSEELLTYLCILWEESPSAFSREILLEIKPFIDILPKEYYYDTIKEIKKACESATRETGTGISDDDGNCDPPDDTSPPESDS